MKKLLSALISAAVIAMPLAVVSTPAAAKTAAESKKVKKTAVKKHKRAKAVKPASAL